MVLRIRFHTETVQYGERWTSFVNDLGVHFRLTHPHFISGSYYEIPIWRNTNTWQRWWNTSICTWILQFFSFPLPGLYTTRRAILARYAGWWRDRSTSATGMLFHFGGYIGDLWFSYYVGGRRPVDDRELTFVVPRWDIQCVLILGDGK